MQRKNDTEGGIMLASAMMKVLIRVGIVRIQNGLYPSLELARG